MSISNTANLASNPSVITNGTGYLLPYRSEIDCLRAVAVVAVLLSHWIPGFAWGMTGVYLFFVISGYVISRGLLNEKEKSGTISLTRFFARRALRIWPIYFLVISFVYFVWPGFKEGEVLWHVLFMSNMLFSIEGKFLFPIHFWSLSVEQQFYLFWPFLILFFYKRISWLCAFAIIVSPLSRWYFFDQLNNIQAAAYALNSNLDCLAIGALLAIYERKIEKTTLVRRVALVAGIASLALLAIIAFYSLAGNRVLTITLLPTATAGISVWLLAWLPSASSGKKMLMNPFILYVGRISYGIYLYHLFIGIFLFETPVGKLPPILFATVASFITLLVAAASWRLIEQPLLSIRR